MKTTIDYRSPWPRTIRTGLVLAALTGWLLMPAARAVVISLPGNNPDVQRIGYQHDGNALLAGANDGDTATTYGFMGSTYASQAGYSLNAWGSVNSVTIRQDTQGGLRKRLLAVDVYTSNRKYTFTGLPDVDDLTLTLDGSMVSQVLIVPVAKQPTGTDDNLGLREIEVNSTTPAFPRHNWALGITPSVSGYGGAPAGLTDGDLYTTTAFTTGGTAVFDLGQVRSIGGFGVGWSVTGTRQIWQSALLEFSNVSNFSSLVGSVNLDFYNQLAFEQIDFGRVDARYVRITDSGRLMPSGSAVDANTGLFELQILEAIPEPSSVLLLALGGGLLYRHRRATLCSAV